jgi:hypothetical protein
MGKNGREAGEWRVDRGGEEFAGPVGSAGLDRGEIDGIGRVGPG